MEMLGGGNPPGGSLIYGGKPLSSFPAPSCHYPGINKMMGLRQYPHLAGPLLLWRIRNLPMLGISLSLLHLCHTLLKINIFPSVSLSVTSFKYWYYSIVKLWQETSIDCCIYYYYHYHIVDIYLTFVWKY